jgi:hypothetical protein
MARAKHHRKKKKKERKKANQSIGEMKYGQLMTWVAADEEKASKYEEITEAKKPGNQCEGYRPADNINGGGFRATRDKNIKR